MHTREQAKPYVAISYGILTLAASSVFMTAVVAHKPRTLCAIEVTMNDGNVYRPSVADTCTEAWAGFKFESLAGRDYRQVLAVLVEE